MIGKWVAVLLLASPAGIAAAQQGPSTKPDQQQSQAQEQTQAKDQQDPLAAAARRAQEQQKNQPRATKVWDNDNLPPTGLAVSVVGTGSTAASDQGARASGTNDRQERPSAAKAASTKDQKADLQKQLDDAKTHLKSVQTDLDIATRTFQLDQQTFYSNPNHDSDTTGATKLKNEQSDVDAKKQEVAEAQKTIDDLNAKLQDLESENAKTSNRPQ